MSKETIKHPEMFAFFRDMGAERSARAVADKFGKDPSYISRLRKKENWDDAILEHEANVAKEVERQTILSRVNLVRDITDKSKELFVDFFNDYQVLKKRKSGNAFIMVDAQGNSRLDVALFEKVIKLVLPQIIQLDSEDEKDKVFKSVIGLPELSKGEL